MRTRKTVFDFFYDILDGVRDDFPLILINILIIIFSIIFTKTFEGFMLLPVVSFFLSLWQHNKKKDEKEKAIRCAKISQAVWDYYQTTVNEQRNSENYKFEQSLNYYKDTIINFCQHVEYADKVQFRDIHKISIKWSDMYEPNLYSVFYEYKFKNFNIKQINETICLFGILDAILIHTRLQTNLNEYDIMMLDFYLTKLQKMSREVTSKKIDDLKNKLFLLDNQNYESTRNMSRYSDEIKDLASFLTKKLYVFISDGIM